jgi:hypothetical protein
VIVFLNSFCRGCKVSHEFPKKRAKVDYSDPLWDAFGSSSVINIV